MNKRSLSLLKRQRLIHSYFLDAIRDILSTSEYKMVTNLRKSKSYWSHTDTIFIPTEKQKQYIISPDDTERVGWIWCLFFAYSIPEIMTFLRSARICFFKQVAKPTLLQFCVVAIAETLRTVGTGLLVFMILPDLDVVKGAMLTNCVSVIPGLLQGSTYFHF